VRSGRPGRGQVDGGGGKLAAVLQPKPVVAPDNFGQPRLAPRGAERAVRALLWAAAQKAVPVAAIVPFDVLAMAHALDRVFGAEAGGDDVLLRVGLIGPAQVA
jgi:hypothetical protein